MEETAPSSSPGLVKCPESRQVPQTLCAEAPSACIVTSSMPNSRHTYVASTSAFWGSVAYRQ